jgi:hypothetical protein
MPPKVFQQGALPADPEVEREIAAVGYDAYLKSIFIRLGAKRISYGILHSNGHSRPDELVNMKAFIERSVLFKQVAPDHLVYMAANGISFPNITVYSFDSTICTGHVKARQTVSCSIRVTGVNTPCRFARNPQRRYKRK